MMTKSWLMPILGVALSAAAFAQTEAPKFYKLDYVVKEVEGGKVVNSRVFSTMLAVQVPGREAHPASIRAGGRVPVRSENNTQFYDLGVNIDARELRESQGDLSLYLSVDINTVTQEATGGIPVTLTRANKWSGSVLVPVKKPTVVFASDDVSSKRQIQLELTGTPVK
jgi:hypothetical protein